MGKVKKSGAIRLSYILNVQKLAAEGKTCAEIATALGEPLNIVWATSRAYGFAMEKGKLFGGVRGRPMPVERRDAIKRLIDLGASDEDLSIATKCGLEYVARIRAEKVVAK